MLEDGNIQLPRRNCVAFIDPFLEAKAIQKLVESKTQKVFKGSWKRERRGAGKVANVVICLGQNEGYVSSIALVST